MNSYTAAIEAPQTSLSLIDRFSRKKVFQTLEKIDSARLIVEDPVNVTEFGSPTDSAAPIHVDVRDQSLFRRMVFGGVIGAAESYMDGQWTTDDLTGLIRAMIRNIESVRRLDFGLSGISRRISRIAHRLRKNTRTGSRKNIHEHYDLGNEFFKLFLDETMNYSSGFFPSENATMHEASMEKMQRICEKLDLKPEDHLLEIGTGWGGLAIHAAQNFGCRVTTTTISAEQFRLAKQRVAEAGLVDQITVLDSDYRDLKGTYDKIVSVEMIEAVGAEYYGQFFECCDRLLADEGAMLLQAITMNDRDYPIHLQSVDFIRKYIFPGGNLPSISALTDAMRRNSKMRFIHMDDMTEHYVRTLQCWHDAFLDRIEDVRQQGFSESFIRKWIFYFCYCEAAFAERRTGSVQLMYAKPACRLDPITPFEKHTAVATPALSGACL